MQELRLVAVSEDGTYLVLATAGRGTRFTLPVDDRLRAAVRGNFSRLGQYEIEVESPLRPKEIQARIRAGETAEEIAATAGIPVERVRWFEGPVLQEREYMAQQAQRVPVRLPGETTPGPTLGDLVAERLTRRGVPADEIDWDSSKRDDNLWRVKLGFVWNGHTRHAEWLFDPRRRHITPNDDEAMRLSADEYVEPDTDDSTVRPFVPRLAAKLAPVAPLPGSSLPGRQNPQGRAEPGYDRPAVRHEPPARLDPPLRQEPPSWHEPRYEEPAAYRSEPRREDPATYRSEPRREDPATYRSEPRREDPATYRSEPRREDPAAYRSEPAPVPFRLPEPLVEPDEVEEPPAFLLPQATPAAPAPTPLRPVADDRRVNHPAVSAPEFEAPAIAESMLPFALEPSASEAPEPVLDDPGQSRDAALEQASEQETAGTDRIGENAPAHEASASDAATASDARNAQDEEAAEPHAESESESESDAESDASADVEHDAKPAAEETRETAAADASGTAEDSTGAADSDESVDEAHGATAGTDPAPAQTPAETAAEPAPTPAPAPRPVPRPAPVPRPVPAPPRAATGTAAAGRPAGGAPAAPAKQAEKAEKAEPAPSKPAAPATTGRGVPAQAPAAARAGAGNGDRPGGGTAATAPAAKPTGRDGAEPAAKDEAAKAPAKEPVKTAVKETPKDTKPETPAPPVPKPAPARPRKSRGRRASVPTWDEIMFGARKPE
ncbi:septation protein SepH [Planotetraspora kaengkrachanensis]|uniref:DUF3071 domain-containing protein n=1 Tax=Planotetraspora kaengkrachanensis TaxID=575193 RepID=A0A8J3M5Q9_9ACTN|nr:septation protein SepH [Planotetraspora kaengkrachanensis]GIG79795.1 hypothetical protein Pka01_29220 [Planotetraspora kaengkrachanensis]